MDSALTRRLFITKAAPLVAASAMPAPGVPAEGVRIVLEIERQSLALDVKCCRPWAPTSAELKRVLDGVGRSKNLRPNQCVGLFLGCAIFVGKAYKQSWRCSLNVVPGRIFFLLG